jgi:hypothetical protein
MRPIPVFPLLARIPVDRGSQTIEVNQMSPDVESRAWRGGVRRTRGVALRENVFGAARWTRLLGSDRLTTEERTWMPEDQQIPSDVGPGPLVDVAQALSDVARSLEAEPDLQHVVEGIVVAVTDTVPGAEQAGVSLREGNILRTVAATNDLVKRLNAIEHELNEGPCVQAFLEHRSYRINDMSQDTRWPRFAAAAQAHGVRSMLGYRLFTSGRTLGALDLYSSQLNAFDAQAEVVGELFAAHAAIALIGSTQQAEWQTELGSRDIIGMAKGILMHRERITDDQAFTLLLSTAQKANMRIHDLAVWLVDDANNTARRPV